MLQHFMTFHIFHTIYIKPLYMLLLPAQVRRSPQTSTDWLAHVILFPRVTDKGGNYLDNPRAFVTNTRAFRWLSTSRSVPYNLPPDQTNAYLYLNTIVSIRYICMYVSKMADRSDVARNAIEIDFRTSKMAAGGHFVKHLRKKIPYRSEMARNVIKAEFLTSKMATAGHFVKNIKNKVPYWSEMARNAIESDFRTSKMAAGVHFVQNCGIDLKW